jgi:hypothetical protein
MPQMCLLSRGNRGGVSRQTGYRLEVTGLPKSASWQDLKDTCRRYGDVTFTQVRRAIPQPCFWCCTPYLRCGSKM